MGAGAFVIAAVLAGRKIFATEIDNYTYSAVITLFSKVDANKLKSEFSIISKDVKSEVMSLYETSCCETLNYISKLLYDPETQEYYKPTPNREIVGGKNVKLITPCPVCMKKRKKFEKTDENKLLEISHLDVSAFPRVKYIENSRINITSSTGADYYDRIFTTRSKKALLIIQKAIMRLRPSVERDVIEHALVSTLTLARIAMYGASSDILYHVIPRGARESNVWELFEGKFNSFVDFKKEYDMVLADNPRSNNKYEISLSSFQDYCENIAKDSFNIIYTDFPYTDQVPYLERNQLYRIWLNTFYSKGKFELSPKMLEQEIVQTDAPSRPSKRSIQTYYADIDVMFSNFYKVLKPQGLVVLTVKLGKSKYFQTLIEIINLARKNGFEYGIRLGIDKNDPSIRKQSAYKNTLANEMIITFEKLDETERYWYVGMQNYEFETVKIIYQLLQKSDNISLTKATSVVKETLLKKLDYITTDDDLMRIQNTIENNFEVGKNAIVRIDCNKLYLDIEDERDLFSKFYDFVPVIIRRLLEAKGKFVLDDLYFEIANTLCNGDPSTISQFLEDPGYQSDITKLLNNYCTTSGKVYVKKNYGVKVSDKAIDISTLEGSEFEDLIKHLLEADGYSDVVNTGGSGDLGVDLLAKKVIDGNSKLFLFQCKRWVSDVGSVPMQRLVSERQRRNADYAICVTTSGYTDDGMKISREQDVEAWDGAKVAQMLDFRFPDKYFNGNLDY
jgi:HJR/Mrr/RecB family endonuclease